MSKEAHCVFVQWGRDGEGGRWNGRLETAQCFPKELQSDQSDLEGKILEFGGNNGFDSLVCFLRLESRPPSLFRMQPEQRDQYTSKQEGKLTWKPG